MQWLGFCKLQVKLQKLHSHTRLEAMKKKSFIVGWLDCKKNSGVWTFYAGYACLCTMHYDLRCHHFHFSYTMLYIIVHSCLLYFTLEFLIDESFWSCIPRAWEWDSGMGNGDGITGLSDPSITSSSVVL